MFISELEEIFPPERIQKGDQIARSYVSDLFGRHGGSAAALVFPQSTDEVSKAVTLANHYRVPVIPRGAGTNLVGSTLPDSSGDALLIDLSRMNRILNIDTETLTLVVEPGVLLSEVQQFVDHHQLFYPPDPGAKNASIGGNISTNAGGMRAVKYGVTRDYVRELEVVLPSGAIVILGSTNVKDATGLSLKNLIIGSEGTLGIVTQATLRLIAKPKFSQSTIIPFDSLDSALNSVPKILSSGVTPTAIEFIEGSVAKLGQEFTGFEFPAPEANAYLLLTFDGTHNQVEADCAFIREILYEYGASDFIYLSESESARAWGIRGSLVNAVEARCEQEPLDLVVPINKTAEFINFVHSLEKQTGVESVGFGHAGDGNVHLCVLRGDRNEDDWLTVRDHFLIEVYKKAAELGGLTSAEHGIGISKRPFYLNLTDPALIDLQRQIKAAIDPRGILNPNKSYSR
ncbi:FAD-binding oxidoreductase [Arcanobacterium ihumii]|uniref:FAD-binding oxidoreductase n=1 Tax=Arcanobacterium ihumii TaxID=2138162 RepID=UPI000F52689F|nr:FAD-binding oxidoreductase [Arcanobacterium ihumii]